jgi:putative peptidoglycan lipid II flippase
LEERTEGPEIVRRHRGLVGRTVLVSALTLFSRLLGFVREVVMASVFGDASAVSDAFFTAWRVPNLFRRLFGEGALSTSLQTAVTEADADTGNAAGRRLFLQTVRLAFLVLVVVSALAMLAVAAMPDRMPGTGWAWLGTDPAPVRDLAVRLLPYVVLVCLAALAGGALNVRGHYFVPSFAPAVMNTIWIGALVWIGFVFGWSESAAGSRAVVLERQWDMARLLAWGVLAGGAVQLLLHAPPLVRFGLLRPGPDEPRPDRAGAGPGPWRVLRGAAPLALGAAVYQVNVMIDGLMAEGMLRDGGPTALYYANRVQQFPLALIATAAIASVFPALKAHGHLRELGAMRSLHDRSQLGVLFLALPAAFGLAVLAHPIASVLFEHGNYGSDGVERVASALRMLALALVPAGAVGLAGRTYIALDDARTPVRLSIWMMALNVVLNVAFVRGLGLDVAGLALATAVTSWGNLVLLLGGLGRRLGLPGAEPGLRGRVARLAAAGVATGVAAAAVWEVGTRTLQVTEASAPRAGLLALAIAAGAGACFTTARLLRLPEWEALRERLARRGRDGTS